MKIIFALNVDSYLSIHSCQLSQTYKCETCEWTTKSIERLQLHQKKGHAQYKCDLCSYSAFSQVSVKNHAQSKHMKTKEMCKKCDFSAENVRQLLRHNTEHHASYKCKVCGIEEKNNYHLKRHIQKVHVRTGITCDMCDFKADTIYLVKKHFKLEHK